MSKQPETITDEDRTKFARWLVRREDEYRHADGKHALDMAQAVAKVRCDLVYGFKVERRERMLFKK